MFEIKEVSGNKEEIYTYLLDSVKALRADETNWLANMANGAALLFHLLPDINWSGFYLLDGKELVLGPFQGKPACVRIPVGRGVCGTAAVEQMTQVVPDVRLFPGHIACDPDSRSEIVLPIIAGERLVGVLDLDSPVPGRFDETDAKYLEQFVQILLAGSAING